MDYTTRREDIMKLKTINSDVEENQYVNTTIDLSRTTSEKHESHVYEDVCRRNFNLISGVKVAKTGYLTRCKKHMNCVLLSLIGVLFAVVIAIGIGIGLPKDKGINGGWSIWGPWSPCSATCDFGTSHRERNCSNPIPEYGGLTCSGNAYDLQLCTKVTCPAMDGGWSAWSAWGDCSATCGTGLRSRTRTCSNPAPEQHGKPCVGDFTDHQVCTLTVCQAIDGGWSAWSAWGTCSATCGTGLQSRNRTCSNPAPEPNGRPCVGDFSNQQLCAFTSCEGRGIGFSVYYAPNVSVSPVKFVNTIYNYNNVYNMTTGEFVCTKQGLYSFHSTLIRATAVSTPTHESYCWLNKNRLNIQLLFIYSTYIYQQATGTAVQYLLPGDRVYIGSCYNIQSLYHYSSFSGFLVGTG